MNPYPWNNNHNDQQLSHTLNTVSQMFPALLNNTQNSQMQTAATWQQQDLQVPGLQQALANQNEINNTSGLTQMVYAAAQVQLLNESVKNAILMSPFPKCPGRSGPHRLFTHIAILQSSRSHQVTATAHSSFHSRSSGFCLGFGPFSLGHQSSRTSGDKKSTLVAVTVNGEKMGVQQVCVDCGFQTGIIFGESTEERQVRTESELRGELVQQSLQLTEEQRSGRQ